MKLTQLVLDELEREAELSRRALKEVPAGKADWKPHVVADGLLITGQDAASSEPAARALLQALE